MDRVWEFIFNSVSIVCIARLAWHKLIMSKSAGNFSIKISMCWYLHSQTIMSVKQNRIYIVWEGKSHLPCTLRIFIVHDNLNYNIALILPCYLLRGISEAWLLCCYVMCRTSVYSVAVCRYQREMPGCSVGILFCKSGNTTCKIIFIRGVLAKGIEWWRIEQHQWHLEENRSHFWVTVEVIQYLYLLYIKLLTWIGFVSGYAKSVTAVSSTGIRWVKIRSHDPDDV